MLGMFGPRINTVFRSKWRALWFAASVLLGAWLAVPATSDKADPDAQNRTGAVNALLQHPQHGGASGRHVNPWAKTPR
jgi:hypothetical protein